MERPIAAVTLGMSLLALVWKGVGITWVPIVGPAMDEMFKGHPTGYYPRRGTAADGTPAADDGAYRALYLAMYGVLGTVGQWAGWQLSAQFARAPVGRKQTLGDTGARRAQRLGAFHVVIGAHHLFYAVSGSRYGKLELHRLGLGHVLGYASTGVAAACCLVYACMLLGATRDSQAAPTLRRKAVLDTVSVMTIVEMLLFLPAIATGHQLSPVTIQWTWRVAMLSLPLVFLLDAVL